MHPHLKVYSYRYLLMAAQRAQLRASEAEGDELVDCMEVMLFSALSLEAFLNHVGSQLFEPWAPLKKKLSPREKLDVMLGARGHSVEFSRRPYQSFMEAFQVRNALAHAETDYVPFPGPSPQPGDLPMSDWMKKCNSENARRILEDAVAIQRHLPALLGLAEDTPEFLLAETIVRPAAK